MAPVFGVPLKKVLDRQKRKGGDPLVPQVLLDCFDYFDAQPDRMGEEGIFRLSGSAIEIKAVIDAYNKGESVNLEERVSDPHIVASVMKTYLRSLPEPLLTFDLYDGFIVAAQKDKEKLLQMFQYLITQLPASNREVMRRVILFLKNCSERSEESKMTITNLATVFGPNVLRPRAENSASLIGHAQWLTKTITLMVYEFDHLFGNENKDAPHVGNVRAAASTPTRSPATHSRKSSPGKSEQSRQSSRGAVSAATESSMGVRPNVQYARALFDYKARNDKEISFEKDDFIIVHVKLPNGWWQGQGMDGNVGMFPHNHVELFEDELAAAAAASQRAVAMHDYTARNDKELSFNKGDVILVMVQNDNGWWQGQVDGGARSGLFPSNYVKLRTRRGSEKKPRKKPPPAPADDKSAGSKGSS